MRRVARSATKWWWFDFDSEKVHGVPRALQGCGAPQRRAVCHFEEKLLPTSWRGGETCDLSESAIKHQRQSRSPGSEPNLAPRCCRLFDELGNVHSPSNSPTDSIFSFGTPLWWPESWRWRYEGSVGTKTKSKAHWFERAGRSGSSAQWLRRWRWCSRAHWRRPASVKQIIWLDRGWGFEPWLIGLMLIFETTMYEVVLRPVGDRYTTFCWLAHILVKKTCHLHSCPWECKYWALRS